MARSSKARRPAKRRGLRWLLYLFATIALVFTGFAAWLWWDMREWRPDVALYPEQGAMIAAGRSDVRFVTLRAIGAEFVYLELREASLEPDSGFAARLDQAREAGLKIGVILRFDPCLRADPQSARFTRMVPRSEEFLPPTIALAATGQECTNPVSDAAVQSELLTLVNQVELHSGTPAILKLGEAFEARYAIANVINRDLWLERDRARPAYASRPWLLWSANGQLVSDAAEEPIEWVVVQR